MESYLLADSSNQDKLFCLSSRTVHKKQQNRFCITMLQERSKGGSPKGSRDGCHPQYPTHWSGQHGWSTKLPTGWGQQGTSLWNEVPVQYMHSGSQEEWDSIQTIMICLQLVSSTFLSQGGPSTQSCPSARGRSSGDPLLALTILDFRCAGVAVFHISQGGRMDSGPVNPGFFDSKKQKPKAQDGKLALESLVSSPWPMSELLSYAAKHRRSRYETLRDAEGVEFRVEMKVFQNELQNPLWYVRTYD